MKNSGTNLNYYTHSSAVTFIPDITYTFQYLHLPRVEIFNASITVQEKILNLSHNRLKLRPTIQLSVPQKKLPYLQQVQLSFPQEWLC
jgi:hypothetical protein